MKKQLAVLLAAAALSACHGRRLAPAQPRLSALHSPPARLEAPRAKLGLPLRAPRVVSDEPATLAEQAARHMKFLADSRAYDAVMRTLPPDQLTDKDRTHMEHNARWFEEDRAALLKMLARLQAWAEVPLSTGAAPSSSLTEADLFRLRLSMPISRAVLISDAPADIAEQAARTTKFVADSKAYDSGMRTIPADKLTDADRGYIKMNEGWFERDRTSLLQLLKRLRGWADASPTVAAAPEKAPE